MEGFVQSDNKKYFCNATNVNSGETEMQNFHDVLRYLNMYANPGPKDLFSFPVRGEMRCGVT